MSVRIAAALCAVIAAAPALAQYESQEAEHEARLVQLSQDKVKLDKAIEVTKKMIRESHAAPYLPDLLFRLAELYVEKSRVVYLKLLEDRQGEDAGALVAPEARLLKQEAIQLYERLIAEYSDPAKPWPDLDKARFYLAHELRELGDYPRAIDVLTELVQKHPKSGLRNDALLIIGDYYFDKKDNAKAEESYKQILAGPESPVHDLARYKMGWVKVNEGDHKSALEYFTAAARPASAELLANSQRVDAAKVLNVKREALLDAAYSYTEVKPAEGAVAYFRKLADSHPAYQRVLKKLANRYFVKQEYDHAAMVYRELVKDEWDPENLVDFASRLYDSVKAAKLVPQSTDVEAIVRAVARYRARSEDPDSERKKLTSDMEEAARDLATREQLEAQKKSDVRLYADAAKAYESYLSLFHLKQWQRTMQQNLAESYFGAGKFVKAGRVYEMLARTASPRDRQDAVYGAVASYYKALQEQAKTLGHLEAADAREGVRQLGSYYVRNWPAAEKAPVVKFDVARVYYDVGDMKKASELFTAFALEYPQREEAVVAAKLALDALAQAEDYDGLAALAKKFVADGRLPSTFLADASKISEKARGEQVNQIMLTASSQGQAAEEGLVTYADSHQGTELGQKALLAAFVAARESRDMGKLDELGRKIVSQYGQSPAAADALSTLGRVAFESGDFEKAAGLYEEMFGRFPGDRVARDLLRNAGEIWMLLGNPQHASADLAKLADAEGVTPAERTQALTRLLDAQEQAGDTAGLEATATRLVKADPGDVVAQAALGRALVAEGKRDAGESALVLAVQRATPSMAGSPQGVAVAGAALRLGDSTEQKLEAETPQAPIDEKVALLTRAETLYGAAVRMNSPDEAVAALAGLSKGYATLARKLRESELPPARNAREAEQVKKIIEQQAGQLEAKSRELVEGCAQKARALDVFTPAAKACVTGTAGAVALGPSRGAAADEDQIKKLKDTLVVKPTDAAALEGLGVEELARGDYKRARLLLSRAVEIDARRASAQNALAVAALRAGDLGIGRAALLKAAELGSDKAKVNLASLRCAMGDREGAKAAAKGITATEVAAGPDVDLSGIGCWKEAKN